MDISDKNKLDLLEEISYENRRIKKSFSFDCDIYINDNFYYDYQSRCDDILKDPFFNYIYK